MDTTAQLVLVLMIIALGSTMTAVGIMVFFVLKDLRDSIRRFNLVLTNFETVSQHLAAGSAQIDELVSSLRQTVETFKTQAASPVGSLVGMFNLVRSWWGRNAKGGEVDE